MKVLRAGCTPRAEEFYCYAIRSGAKSQQADSLLYLEPGGKMGSEGEGRKYKGKIYSMVSELL